MMLRVLGVADTHVTSSMGMAGMRPTGASGAPLILEQHRRFWRWLVDVVRRERVDLVIHAGDVYETCRPTPADEAAVVEGALAIAEICPFVIMPGNHDIPVGGGTHALEPLRHVRPGRIVIADTQVPLYLVGQTGVESMVLAGVVPAHGINRRLALFPLPYPTRAYLGEHAQSAEHTNALITGALQVVLDDHARVASALPQDVVTCIAVHGTLSGASFNDYQIAPAGDVQVGIGGVWDRFDLQLAGHIHKRQDAPGTGGLPGYVGSPDRHDFGEEHERKGVSLFEVDPGIGRHGEDPRVIHRFIEYPGARRFATVAVAGDFADAEGGGLYPTFDGLTDERTTPDETVYRLKGLVTPIGFSRAARLVRGLRAQGFIIANETEVVHEARARVEMGRTADVAAALEAVFKARPALAAAREVVVRRVTEIRSAHAAGL